jgi:hypothetical protein
MLKYNNSTSAHLQYIKLPTPTLHYEVVAMAGCDHEIIMQASGRDRNVMWRH